MTARAYSKFISKMLVKAKRAEHEENMKCVGTNKESSHPGIMPWEMGRYMITC